MWTRPSLLDFAKRYGTDKWGSHFYIPHYERHFAPYRDQTFNLLEIGVGGYKDPALGGESLRMWQDYFPNATIVGIDLYEKHVAGPRIRVYQGDQTDAVFLERVVAEAGPFRLIIDDGSHLNAHVIRTFEILYPTLELGGVYAVEDLQTSYWSSFGGDMEDLAGANTSLNFLKSLVDAVNYAERQGGVPSYVERHTVGVHFYHNLCFVDKRVNDEPSNIVKPRLTGEP